FISTEIHKNFSPLFNPATPADYKTIALANLAKRYTFVNEKLEGRDYLTGSQFSVAAAYLFTVTRWAAFLQIDLAPYPNVQAFQARVAARPKVQDALKAEGLVK